MMISCNLETYHCRVTKDNEDLMLHGKNLTTSMIDLIYEESCSARLIENIPA